MASGLKRKGVGFRGLEFRRFGLKVYRYDFNRFLGFSVLGWEFRCLGLKVLRVRVTAY